MSELAIIVPIKVNCYKQIQGLGVYYSDLLKVCAEYKIEVFLPDCSNLEIFTALHQEITHYNVHHFRPQPEFLNGKNGKLNNIHAALFQTASQQVVIMDDDCRPTMDLIITILEKFKTYDFFRCMPSYEKLSLYDRIDYAGIYLINLISPYKQFWGNIAFKTNLVNANQFLDKDILFDDFALEQSFRQKSKSFCYIKTPKMLMNSANNGGKFIEQRIRYAYENIALPLRFSFFLSILPILILLSFLNISLLWLTVFSITLTVMLLAGIGQRKYAPEISQNFTWCFAPLWFWFYPFTSWIALGFWFTGGIRFGTNKLKKAK